MSKPITQSSRTVSRRRAVHAGLSVAGLSATTVWHRPIVNALLLPAHAQTSVVASLSVALGDVRSGESLSGTIEGALSGEVVQITIKDPESDAMLRVSTTANGNGEARFSVPAAELAAAGLAAESGDRLRISAATQSGRSGVTTGVVDSGDIGTLTLSLVAASASSGVSGSVSGAKSGERITLTLTEKSTRASVGSTLKANARGSAAIAVGAEALRSAGFSLKDGSVVEASVRTAAGKTAKASIAMKGSVAPAKLTATLSVDAEAGANGNVFGGEPGDTVTITLMDADTGKSLDVKVKADSSGNARYSASASSLKAAGFSLKKGSKITALARSGSGREGTASADVTGTEAPAELTMSASLSTRTGGSISLSNAAAGDGVTVTLTEAATGATLSVRAKASERGDVKVAVSVDQLKSAGFSMKAGSEVSIAVKTTDGRATKTSVKFA